MLIKEKARLDLQDKLGEIALIKSVQISDIDISNTIVIILNLKYKES